MIVTHCRMDPVVVVRLYEYRACRAEACNCLRRAPCASSCQFGWSGQLWPSSFAGLLLRCKRGQVVQLVFKLSAVSHVVLRRDVSRNLSRWSRILLNAGL